MASLLAFDRSKLKKTKLITPDLYVNEKTNFSRMNNSTVFSSARKTAVEEGDYNSKPMSQTRSVVNEMRMSSGFPLRSRHARNLTNADFYKT